LNKNTMWSYFETAVTQITKWCAGVSIVAITLMMLLGVLDIAGTKIFNNGIPSAYDISQQLNVALVFMSMAYVTLERGHITMNVIEDHVSQGVRRIMKLTGEFLSILLCIFLSWRSFILFQRLIENGQPNRGQIEFPLWPFALLVFIGFVLMSVAFILVFVKGIIYPSEDKNASSEVLS
jgi:TRAP-type C4-dicarboxylate transport system permease small subunit